MDDMNESGEFGAQNRLGFSAKVPSPGFVRTGSVGGPVGSPDTLLRSGGVCHMRLAEQPLRQRDYRVLELIQDGRWKTIMWLTRHASDSNITYQQTGVSCALRILRAHGYPVVKHRVRVDWTRNLYVYGLKKTEATQ